MTRATKLAATTNTYAQSEAHTERGAPDAVNRQRSSLLCDTNHPPCETPRCTATARTPHE